MSWVWDDEDGTHHIAEVALGVKHVRSELNMSSDIPQITFTFAGWTREDLLRAGIIEESRLCRAKRTFIATDIGSHADTITLECALLAGHPRADLHATDKGQEFYK